MANSFRSMNQRYFPSPAMASAIFGHKSAHFESPFISSRIPKKSGRISIILMVGLKRKTAAAIRQPIPIRRAGDSVPDFLSLCTFICKTFPQITFCREVWSEACQTGPPCRACPHLLPDKCGYSR